MTGFSKQEQRVLDYMSMFGSITPLQAFADLGVTRLAAVIFNIKKKVPALRIETEILNSKNRFQESVRYAKYYFGKQENNNGQ